MLGPVLAEGGIQHYNTAKMKLHTAFLLSSILILSGSAILSCGMCEESDYPEYNYYCSETDECISKSRTCNGQCTSGKRYCPRYKVIFLTK